MPMVHLLHCDDCQQRLKIGFTQSHALRNVAKSWGDCSRVPMWPMYEVWVPFPGTIGHNKGLAEVLGSWVGCGASYGRIQRGAILSESVKISRNIGFTGTAITSSYEVRWTCYFTQMKALEQGYSMVALHLQSKAARIFCGLKRTRWYLQHHAG